MLSGFKGFPNITNLDNQIQCSLIQRRYCCAELDAVDNENECADSILLANQIIDALLSVEKVDLNLDTTPTLFENIFFFSGTIRGKKWLS